MERAEISNPSDPVSARITPRHLWERTTATLTFHWGETKKGSGRSNTSRWAAWEPPPRNLNIILVLVGFKASPCRAQTAKTISM
eukprot:6478180-Pyramimonas_sp.AAC.1